MFSSQADLSQSCRLYVFVRVVSRIFNALGAARAVYYCRFNVPESSGKAIIGRLAGFKRVAKPIRNKAGATPSKVADLKPWLILVVLVLYY